MSGETKKQLLRVVPDVVPPLVWSLFSWLLFVALSERLSLPFYGIVEGPGVTEYSSAIVLVSQPIVEYLLVAGSAALVAVHANVLRGRPARDVKALLAPPALVMAALSLDLVFPSWISISLLAFSFSVIFTADVSWLASARGVERRQILTQYTVGLTGIAAAIAVVSSGRWIANGFQWSQPLSDPSWGFAFVGLQILGFLYPIVPQLTFFALLAWVLLSALQGRSGRAGDETEGPARGALSAVTSGRWSIVALGLAVAVAAFVGIYPYLPAVNPSSALVGVDVKYCYSHWLNGLPLNEPTVCVGTAWASDRIGALWLLRLLTSLSGSPDLALEAMPALLGVFLVLSTYALALEGTGERFVAGLSALLAAVSSQVVAGIGAGILANWMAISLAFLFFAALLRGARTQRLYYLLPCYALLVALVFVHPWTFALTSTVLLVYLAVEILGSASARNVRAKGFEAVFLGTLLAAALASVALGGSLPVVKGLATAYSTVVPHIQASGVYSTLVSLQAEYQYYTGGAMADPAWFLLALAGVTSIPGLPRRFRNLLLIWTAGLLAGVILNPGGDLQMRFIYDLPLQLFAAVGLSSVVRMVFGSSGWEATQGKRLLVATAVLSLVSVEGLLLGFALEYAGFV